MLRTGHRPLRPGHRCPGAQANPRPCRSSSTPWLRAVVPSTPAASWVSWVRVVFSPPRSAHSAQRLSKSAQRLHFLLHPAHQRKDRLSWSSPSGRSGSCSRCLSQFGCGLVQGLLLRRDGVDRSTAPASASPRAWLSFVRCSSSRSAAASACSIASCACPASAFRSSHAAPALSRLCSAAAIPPLRLFGIGLPARILLPLLGADLLGFQRRLQRGESCLTVPAACLTAARASHPPGLRPFPPRAVFQAVQPGVCSRDGRLRTGHIFDQLHNAVCQLLRPPRSGFSRPVGVSFQMIPNSFTPSSSSPLVPSTNSLAGIAQLVHRVGQILASPGRPLPVRGTIHLLPPLR